MRNRLTAFILTGMILGVIVGFATNLWVGGDEALAKQVAGYFHLLADIFLHLIKMIIAPLVFSTLVAGIAHMVRHCQPDFADVGPDLRQFLRTGRWTEPGP